MRCSQTIQPQMQKSESKTLQLLSVPTSLRLQPPGQCSIRAGSWQRERGREAGQHHYSFTTHIHIIPLFRLSLSKSQQQTPRTHALHPSTRNPLSFDQCLFPLWVNKGDAFLMPSDATWTTEKAGCLEIAVCGIYILLSAVENHPQKTQGCFVVLSWLIFTPAEKKES